MKKQLKQVFINEEEPPKFEFDFDQINKQVSEVRASISEVCRDGIVTDAEFSRVFMQMQILEGLLTGFKDKKFADEINKSANFFNDYKKKNKDRGNFSKKEIEAYGFTTNDEDYNRRMLNERHIKEYFTALMGLVHGTRFKVKNG